ncbi:unnamed protein product [Angiostrongylus costaricensis]|uniref:Coiled-coil domain-containing protein 6 n=1 Tax=Angiostrongylus costaricensis TaxID=334426 RepID=A0A158PHM9_ANGCS|nr:unnamed protein product [Angiostrongylus costaricensis]
MEEILELQRRLDDLTPALAAKEARLDLNLDLEIPLLVSTVTKKEKIWLSLLRIIQLASERDDLSSKLRTLNETVAQLKLDLREKEHVGDLYTEKIKSVNEDVERAKDEVLHLKNESLRRQQKEDQLLENLFTLRNQLREAQLKHNNDKALQEKISAENSNLIEENSRLMSEITRIRTSMEREREEREHDIEAQAHGEIVELRLHVKAHKTQIGILEERLQAAIQRCDQLNKELEVHTTSESAARDERLRVQRELDALQALSKSLSSENKSLREDKVLLMEKVEALENLIVSKENTIAEMEDILMAKDRDRGEAVQHTTEEIIKRQQRSLEFEELSRCVKELSETIGYHDGQPSKTLSSDSRREQFPSSTDTFGSFHRRLSSIPESMHQPQSMQHFDQAQLSCLTCPTSDVVEMTRDAKKALTKKQL